MYRRLKLATRILFSKKHIVVLFKNEHMNHVDAHCSPLDILAVSLFLDEQHSIVSKQESAIEQVNELINHSK